MRIMQNTLYVLTPSSYLSLDGENVVVLQEEKEVKRIPLHNLESIITFGYTGASPALMAKCAEYKIALSFMSQNGRFLAKVVGKEAGNVILRKTQYRHSDDINKSAEYARNFLIGKIHNCRSVINRAIRDYPLRLDCERLQRTADALKLGIDAIKASDDLDSMRGIEGECAKAYFGVFDHLILQQKEDFVFSGRSKRPPKDPVNAMLSFLYTLLAHDVSAALTAVGLDAYVGFLHRDRPGRISLALDVMEELRPIVVDRFVLTLINKSEVKAKGFTLTESGGVTMDDDTRRSMLGNWQTRKKEEITHPFLNEKIPWGLVPYTQALLLARRIRGDIDEYPPFFWK